MKKLIIMFPGAGYGMDCPLLYYADFIFEVNGYERLYMNYQDILLDSKILLKDKLKQLRDYQLEQVKPIDFKEYSEIIFLSKSVGTVEAGLLAKTLEIDVKQILLTPLEEALPYCTENSYIVIGTEDKAYSIYKKYCDENNVKSLFIDGADHSLEIKGKPYESIDTLKQIMKFIATC